MATPDPAAPVLLTGCDGYIGTWSTVACLRAGHAVRGTAQDVSAARDLFAGLFADLPDGPALAARLQIVPAELLDAASWSGLADGCRAVVHIACPVVTEVGTPQAEMIDPALVGTGNVLREAARAGGIERVVYMSSIVALLDQHRPRPRGAGPESVGPEDWNETASPATDPYAYAKVRGERLARSLVDELMPGAAFAAVLPGAVIGPPATGARVPASIEKAFEPLLGGQIRWGAVDLQLALVDVRDVAAVVAGLLGLERGRLEALGAMARFLCVSPPATSLLELADGIRARAPAYAPVLPRRLLPLPRPLLLAAMRFAVTREAYSYTRAMLGRRIDYRTALAEQVLGIRWRSIAESAGETVDWLTRHGHHAPPGS